MDISIIIPLYKGDKYCKNLLYMLDQNLLYKDLYKNCAVEVIFVNDYPSETIVLDNIGSHKYRIQLIVQERNRGIHSSRVKGLKKAKGNYVIMLDQDDLVTENWLYSQWNRIKKEDKEYCVCNGWIRRFQILCSHETMEKRVNDIEYYFKIGNPIISPGQVIIRREDIPEEWMLHIQHVNGSDDFLLWIMALKKGKNMVLNKEYLFYHIPERTRDSVSISQMVNSMYETVKILDELQFLLPKEKELLQEQIEQMMAMESERYKKFYSMFCITYNWLKLKNCGKDISTYLKEKGYKKIAIYGMGYIGECLYEELENTDIKVLYGIDRLALDYQQKLPIYSIEQTLESVDAIIITIINRSWKIKEIVQEKMSCHVYIMEDILYDMKEKDKN